MPLNSEKYAYSEQERVNCIHVSREQINNITSKLFVEDPLKDDLTPDDPNQYLYSSAYQYRTSGQLDIPISQLLPLPPNGTEEPLYGHTLSDHSNPKSIPYFYPNVATLTQYRNSHDLHDTIKLPDDTHMFKEPLASSAEVLKSKSQSPIHKTVLKPTTNHAPNTLLPKSNISKQTMFKLKCDIQSSPVFKHPETAKLPSNLPKPVVGIHNSPVPKPAQIDSPMRGCSAVSNHTATTSSSDATSSVLQSTPTKTCNEDPANKQSPVRPIVHTPLRPSTGQSVAVHNVSSISNYSKQNFCPLQSSSKLMSPTINTKQSSVKSLLNNFHTSDLPVLKPPLKLESPVFKLSPSKNTNVSLSSPSTVSSSSSLSNITPDLLLSVNGSGCSSLESRVITELSYIIVIDFESTCWDQPLFGKKRGPPPEIIEFPAVVVNIQTGEIEDQFQQYVMPTEQPKLSDFCTKFTGITQSQVDEGVPLKTCLWMFSEWFEIVAMERHLVPQGRTGGAQFSFVTWTDWDLNVCLPNECARKGLQMPKPLRQWVDLKAVYRDWCGRGPRGLRQSMDEMGLTFEGREHSGLTDAQNTARLALALVHEGLELHLSLAAMC